jgi:hypothetical protein
MNESLGYGIIELTVKSITKNDNEIIITMDGSKCIIDNIPLFHDNDFGECLFIDIDTAEYIFDDVIKNSALAKNGSSKEVNSESILPVSIDTEINDEYMSTMLPQE